MSWSAAFYDESHRLIRRHWAIALFDAAVDVILPLPFSDTWTHEEFHRAVLANRGVASFDDVYRFRFDPRAVAVSHVRDDNLVRLKAEHPADLVRAHEAGVEGEHAMVVRLEQQRFFRGETSWNLPLYWFSKANSIAYILSGSTQGVNRLTEKWERDEGAAVSRRDFTGHDFTAWVYDLFRPDEPYTARGTHPSGVGLRRYVRESDLSSEELRYLHRQGRLALLNLLDPNLLDRGGGRFSASAAHVLTPFGYTIDINALAQPNVMLTLHGYRNGRRNFFGVEGALHDRVRVALWRQPEHQLFRDKHGRLGALVSVRLHRAGTFAELEAKSAGWVEGNVHLDRSVTLRIGRAIR